MSDIWCTLDYAIKAKHGLAPVSWKSEKVNIAVVTALESSESAEVPKKVRNLGKPPEGFGIDIVTETRPFSDTVPECAESTEDKWVWFYNRPAFDQLVKMWVLHLPSEEQFLAHINAIPGNIVVKAWVMNPESESFPGRHSAADGRVLDRVTLVFWWVISPDGSARCVWLNRVGYQYIGSGSLGPRNGFLVPEIFG